MSLSSSVLEEVASGGLIFPDTSVKVLEEEAGEQSKGTNSSQVPSFQWRTGCLESCPKCMCLAQLGSCDQPGASRAPGTRPGGMLTSTCQERSWLSRAAGGRCQ